MGRNHTHTRVQRVQAQYTLCNDTCTVRVQKREISIHHPGWPCQNTVQEVQAQYTLCNGTTTVRINTRANRYTARAGHAKPLYKGYTHSTHYAINRTRTVRVQKRVKCTSPVLAMPDHCTRVTSIVHTVQWHNHSTNTHTGQ